VGLPRDAHVAAARIARLGHTRSVAHPTRSARVYDVGRRSVDGAKEPSALAECAIRALGLFYSYDAERWATEAPVDRANEETT
jgi:hypothetical protein